MVTWESRSNLSVTLAAWGLASPSQKISSTGSNSNNLGLEDLAGHEKMVTWKSSRNLSVASAAWDLAWPCPCTLEFPTSFG